LVKEKGILAVSFKIIDGQQKPLLLGTTGMELGLITMHTVCNVTSNKLIEQYGDVFKGLWVMNTTLK